MDRIRSLAPIALFVYNRLEHIKQTICALQNNKLAEDSELFIFSDAAHDNSISNNVQEVRDYLSSITGFKKIHITERKKNLGLAKSIIDGVTSLCNKYGKVIVLEDDLITSPYFIEYMNDALDCYEHEDRVMHIAGYTPPFTKTSIDQAFFLRISSCWGWATWARAWKHFEKNPQKLISIFDKQMIHQFNMDGTYDYWSQVLLNHSGELNTWAVFWYATVFRRDGLCLHPPLSMVANIGNDGSGVNCGITQDYEVNLASYPVTKLPDLLIEDQLALASVKLFNKSLKLSVYRRLITKLKSSLFKAVKG